MVKILPKWLQPKEAKEAYRGEKVKVLDGVREYGLYYVWYHIKRANYPVLATYAALILISYQFMYPILRMIMTSIMSMDDIIDPAVNWLPSDWSFGNLRLAFYVMEPQITMLNSIWFSGLLATGATLIAATTGFAFARYDFIFKNFWFLMVLFSFIVPVPVLMVPRLMMMLNFFEHTGIVVFATPYPQILMAFLGQGVFSAILILIFYNFTKMIPRSLDEAASIDGASSLQVFYHVILKLSVPTLLVVFLLSFVWNWNETYITEAILRDGIQLMPARLYRFEQFFIGVAQDIGAAGAGDMVEEDPMMARINEAFRMAGTLLSMLPLFVLYLLVQRQFIKGIENTGITGE